VRIHENHHLWSKPASSRKLDGQFELIFETADLVEPDPFPRVTSKRLPVRRGYQ